MARCTIVAVFGLMVAGIPFAWAQESPPPKAPDFYIGPGVEFDLEADETNVTVSFAGAGKGRIAPDFGLYDDKLLLGVRYMLIGTRADLDAAVYGGPTLFWYDDHIGGGLIVGRHLSERVIIEASYRATEDWQGMVDFGVGYGLDWPW